MKLMQKVIGVGMLCIALNACKKDPSTPPPPTTTVKDVDGNVYHTVKIGDKYWTVENAQMTHFRNKDTIFQQIATNNWTSTTTPAWCYYNNTIKADTQSTYGKLYNWYTINHKGADGKPDFAPIGYHVPDTAEINALIVALGGIPKDGGDTTVGGKLKEADITHWTTPNRADNSSGFTALPAGFRSSNGGANNGFNSIGTYFYIWSSTSKSTTNSYYYYLRNSSSTIYRDDNNIHGGYSVRFVKD